MGRPALRYRKALSTNSAATSFTAKIPTITEPSGDGVIAFEAYVPSFIEILPYAIGDDDDVFDFRVWGWRSTQQGKPRLWIPSIMGIFTCTISTVVGLATHDVLNTERFADTITLKTDNNVSQPTARGTDNAGAIQMGDIQIMSPTGNIATARIIMPLQQFEKIEFDFDATTGDPTSMNCLITFPDE